MKTVRDEPAIEATKVGSAPGRFRLVGFLHFGHKASLDFEVFIAKFLVCYTIPRPNSSG